MNRKIVFGLSVALILAGCTKEEESSGVQLSIPYVTSPVSGASLMSTNQVGTMATVGIPLNLDSCSSCGSGNLAKVFSLASLFALQGKLADANSCMTKAVAAAGVIPGLTSGEYRYFTSGDVTNRLRIQMDGTTVASFEMITCQNGTQVQYMSTTNNGTTGTFKFRSDGGNGSLFAAMDATGTLSGDTWTSKTLNVGMYSSGSGHSYFTMTQGSDYLDINGILDNGTVGTLDANDIRFVSRAQLLGNSLRTYALGDGSIRTATGSGGASNSNWNGDTKAEGSGPTTYDSYVASATLPAIPTSHVSAFTSDETWNCQATDPVDLQTAAQGNQGLMQSAMTCMEIFQ